MTTEQIKQLPTPGTNRQEKIYSETGCNGMVQAFYARSLERQLTAIKMVAEEQSFAIEAVQNERDGCWNDASSALTNYTETMKAIKRL